ncbi:hypothetical protein ACEPPN_000164 [Leptodophora sp. 'Broadleaf-Isolate-01']
MRMVQLTSEISFRLIKAADGAWTEEHERQWIKEASLTCGGGDNKSITSIQVNLTAIKKSDEVGEESEASAYPVQTTPETDIQEYDTDTSDAEEADLIKVGKDIMEETFKEKSHVRQDGHDERRNLYVILFLNHVPKDHFVGR